MHTVEWIYEQNVLMIQLDRFRVWCAFSIRYARSVHHPSADCGV